jgi:hypothetical protein
MDTQSPSDKNLAPLDIAAYIDAVDPVLISSAPSSVAAASEVCTCKF